METSGATIIPPDRHGGHTLAVARTAGAPRLLGTSIAARLPLAMFSIALLVHTRYLTGSFAMAGVVTGGYAAAVGVGSPLLGRLVDRRGQTFVLLASAGAGAAALVAAGVLPRGTPVAALAGLAVVAGLATPPLGACVRALLPGVLPDPGALRAAYAFESSAVELTFIFGPPLALGLGALWSTGAALAAGGVMLLLATAAFAAQPASRRWRPPRGAQRRSGGSLRAPGMRTLVIVLAAVGVVFGAVEVGVTAAAHALGGTAAAGPLLAVWGVGSLAGGMLAARLGGGARTGRGLALVLAALAAGHLLPVVASGSVVALGVVMFAAGAAIAPAYASIYGMVEHVAPAGTVTEAFAWLATAVAVGTAAGAAAAGALADRVGPGATFVLAGAAGGAAVAVTLTRARTLPARAAPPRAVPGSGAARSGHAPGRADGAVQPDAAPVYEAVQQGSAPVYAEVSAR